MNKLRGLIKKRSFLFANFKKREYDYNFFEYQPYKFREERKLVNGDYNTEELLGVSSLGYESNNYRA